METAMLASSRCLAFAACLSCLAACQRAPDTDGMAQPESPASATATAAGANGPASPSTAPVAAAPAADGTSGTTYACADGTRLQASFGDRDATLQWPDGRRLVLPRAESASKGGGDVYVGDTVSLQRDGVRLQLRDGNRAATDCDPATAAATPVAGGSSNADVGVSSDAAAARYACEGDTILIRKEDGSYRAEVPGNPPVRLTRIAGSTPPVYTGASLYLRIGDGGDAILSQGDRTNELRCAAAG
jgi:membrane-bound inhibitor of C-type lysozyme